MKNKVKLVLSLVAVALSFQAQPESCGFNLEAAEEVASCPNEYLPVVPTGKINPENFNEFSENIVITTNS